MLVKRMGREVSRDRVRWRRKELGPVSLMVCDMGGGGSARPEVVSREQRKEGRGEGG
jgi:hypothetical protein